MPPEIAIEGEGIDAETAAFLQSVYENGLGEFAYRNGLSLRGRIVFPTTAAAAAPAPPLSGKGQDGAAAFASGPISRRIKQAQ